MSLKKDKKDILKDHEVKQGGVYLLFNKLNNHFYVGSTISIKGRMKNYLNISYLNLQQNNNMPITKALFKYNYDSFSLIIIEYLLDSAPSRMHCIRDGDESSPITM
jgi:group I intron endonuclease